jgi:hypothetical protein
MKSDFRNDPKGAKRDSKGNIISCPLFSWKEKICIL